MEFHVGDPVMHWTYGFGHVVGIEERVIAERKSLYFAISIRDLTVWVPVDDQLGSRLRHPTTKEEFQGLFTILAGTGEPLPLDRQERKMTLVEKLKDGRAVSLCRVLRDLATYQQAHPLNDNDQNLMKRSREALLGEWNYALAVPVAEADAELRRMLALGTTAGAKA
ncbi:MAG TPA: CarD family transcriptional regulator [Anaerolineales bacterium]|nr:CarD family transcriptional regulator [Anaerolineales bacterium]